MLLVVELVSDLFTRFVVCSRRRPKPSLLKLLRSGDIHPNPGPEASTDNLDTSSRSSSYSDLINSGLSVVHLNTQTKLDPIEIELQHYDVLIFSETWLSPDISNANLKLTIFSTILLTSQKTHTV